MGYYTYHDLVVLNDKGEYLPEETEKHEKLLTRKVFGEDGFDPDSQILFEDSAKWYDSEKDMREHSAEYPDLMFELHGEGEENEDVWIEYFKNGKMQRCQGKVVYPDFDPAKMK